MADPRLNSMHLGLLPRRLDYRRARDGLLAVRGWATLAAERAGVLMGDEDGPVEILPGTKYLLVDREAECCYPLRTGLNTVGRLPDNDIVFEEICVSRRHCVLLVHAWGGCELHDTASLNRTLVNGRRVEVERPVRLASGDTIRVCNHVLLFVSERDYRAGIGDYPDTAAGLE